MSEHPFDQKDPAARRRAIEADMRAKAATRPHVNNQGTPTGPLIQYRYDDHGKLIGPVDTKPPAV
jgi:YD repeat-containing protein